MKAVFYLNNEDGTFTKLNYEVEVDAYDRPYKGDGCGRGYLIYDIEIKDDIMYCYVCKLGSDLLDGIERYQVEILDHPYINSLHMSPEKYLEGKKCCFPNGNTFIMGKILQRYPVKEEHILFPELYKEYGGARATCVI
jgi:hypothetical protein